MDGLPHREFEHFLARGVNGICPDGSLAPPPTMSTTCSRAASGVIPSRVQGLGCHPVGVTEQAEQDVLGTDETVV